jgi:predicted outer membrane protein
MNRPICHLVLAGALSALVCSLPVAAAEPEKGDRPNADRGSYRDKDTSRASRPEARDMDSSPESFVRAAFLGGLKEVRMSQIAMERSESTEVKTFAQRMIQDHTKVNNQLMQLAQRRAWTMPPTNTFQAPYPTTAGGSVEPGRERNLRADGSLSNDRNRTDLADAPTTDRERRDYNADRQIRGKDVSDKQASEKQSPEARWDRMQMQGRMSLEGLKNTPTAEFDKSYAREVLRGHSYSVQKYEHAAMNSSDEEVRTFAKNTLPQLQDHHRQAKQLAQSLGVSVEHRENKKSPTSTSDFDQRKRE